MKLSQFVSAVSVLDDFTLRHLRTWCERHRPTSEEPDRVCARMVVFLEAMDCEDREFYISQGWTFTFDRMDEREMRQAGESNEDMEEMP